MKTRYKIAATIVKRDGTTADIWVEQCGIRNGGIFIDKTNVKSRAVKFMKEADAQAWKDNCERFAANDKTGYWNGSTFQIVEVTG